MIWKNNLYKFITKDVSILTYITKQHCVESIVVGFFKAIKKSGDRRQRP